MVTAKDTPAIVNRLLIRTCSIPSVPTEGLATGGY
jgi:hypothetical protein